ncbi:pilus assembly protein PilP [Candidatus Symbiobacter mobilis]|uniref:Type IV pilus assembly protein PilP n=1 Tax=Candidatus Symbiobacter mobilis CR TaxID=946483 RepID=U5NBF3_9BURK|nr:pilus assembly protein PilP [Candidatus Symbiobacter mobilis]AGX87573.1 type IV pilus assembly protein PilP [Candidatus Symbiobacter mobilis CR]
MSIRFFFLLLTLAATLLLAACGASSEEELQQWMTEQRTQAHPKVKPIAEPKQFKPETYTMLGQVEPFSNQKLTQALKKESTLAASNGALVAPELTRRKEPLEEYPLDSMTMVGTMVQEARPVALVLVNNLLYQVRVGDHLGQNYGRVMDIDETQITLREVVQDSAGEWVERLAHLQLQEKGQNEKPR